METNNDLGIAVSSGTATINQWGIPNRVEVLEFPDKIEMVYKEESNITYTTYPATNEFRVFKIIFSCKDGKWNKSDRIYGTIIQETKESYEF